MHFAAKQRTCGHTVFGTHSRFTKQVESYAKSRSEASKTFPPGSSAGRKPQIAPINKLQGPLLEGSDPRQNGQSKASKNDSRTGVKAGTHLLWMLYLFRRSETHKPCFHLGTSNLGAKARLAIVRQIQATSSVCARPVHKKQESSRAALHISGDQV